MSRFRLVLTALAVTFGAAACQDHHFVPYDEMGPLPEPQPGAQAPIPPGAQAPAPAPAFEGLIASGVVELSPELSGAAGWTLYVIARGAEGGPALAAVRIDNVKFPAPFSITGENLMMGAPEPGMRLSIEAIYDSDGDPISKSADDLYGRAEDTVDVGASDVTVTLARRRG